MSQRGVIEIFGLAVATPIVAAVLALGFYGMAWYGKHSGWSTQRTRNPQAHQGETHHPVYPFRISP